MTTAKADILVTGPLVASLMAAIERDFTMHKLWLAPDRNAYLKEHGGVVGANASLIEALPKLEIISGFGVGYDAIDLDACRRRGIIVTNTPNVLNECVADTAMALLLAVSRRICEADRFLRAGKWLQAKFPLAVKVSGKKCCIAGLGNIGSAIAARASGFGMKIGYYDPAPKPDLGYKRYDDLESMARDADYLVVSAVGGAGTRHLINAKILTALGKKGFLINVARGSLVDQDALVKALVSGEIAGAGLDVFADEPNVPPELIELENVVLTPHVASGTNETRQAMGELVFANLQAHFAGKPVLTRVV